MSRLETILSHAEFVSQSAEIQACMPFGRDKRVTFRAIRLMMDHIDSLSEQERAQHAAFLNALTKHIRLAIREFVRLEESTKESININRVNKELNIL